MSGRTGREMKMAFAKFAANSWGVAASVTKGVYFESDAGMQLRINQVADNAFGQSFIGPASNGLVEAPDLTFRGRSRYEDHCYILDALAMGSPAAIAISTSANGQVTSWSHVVDLAPSIDGLGATFAIDKVQYVEELTSAKIYGFEESNDDIGALNVSYRVMGSKPTPISSININSTVAGASYPSLGNRVVQQQGVFRMNAQAGGSLASGDTQVVESVRLTFTRPQDGPHVFGQDYIIEPADDGWPDAMVELTFPRMSTVSANSLFVGLQAGASSKADWTFTSGLYINSTDAWQKKYQFPYLQFLPDGFAANTNGPQQVKPVARFALRLPSAAPTGMSGVVTPIRLTRIMQNSVAPFA